MVFDSEDDIAVAMNHAKFARDEGLMDLLARRSCLNIPGLRESVKLRYAGAKFLEDLPSDNVDKSFKLHLVAEDFRYVLTKVSDMLRGGVVNHCVLELVVGSVSENSSPNVKVMAALPARKTVETGVKP